MRLETAVALVWFDWMPPVVTTQSAPVALASARRNSSFRILLPLSSSPVWSSRLIHTWKRGTRDRTSRRSQNRADASGLAHCTSHCTSGAAPGRFHRSSGVGRFARSALKAGICNKEPHSAQSPRQATISRFSERSEEKDLKPDPKCPLRWGIGLDQG